MFWTEPFVREREREKEKISGREQLRQRLFFMSRRLLPKTEDWELNNQIKELSI